MRILKRYFVLLILLAVQLLYIPINQAISGGYLVKANLDNHIPLQPAWVWLYLICIPLWIILFAWAGYKMEDSLFWELWLSSMITFAIGILIFIVIPTYVERPIITGQGWSSDLLRFIYERDRVYNAFPSSHIYITCILAIFFVRWKAGLRIPAVIAVFLIICSTLFTKQHSVLDSIGGLGLAYMGTWLGTQMRVVHERAQGMAYKL